MRTTIRRVVRTITPAPARRQARLVFAKRRIVGVYGGIRRSPTESLRSLLFDHELDNFTYQIANPAELAQDREVARAIGSRLARRTDRNRSMPFGRRLGWYAIARLRRPGLIVETGVHDGLGSTALLRALPSTTATIDTPTRRPSSRRSPNW
jgi:hypothetical protein